MAWFIASWDTGLGSQEHSFVPIPTVQAGKEWIVSKFKEDDGYERIGHLYGWRLGSWGDEISDVDGLVIYSLVDDEDIKHIYEF